MAVHTFGSTVDGSAVIEQVPSQGPALPTATTAPKRPKRGTVGKVRDDATATDLVDFLTSDNGYWTYLTQDIPIIRVSFDDWATYSIFRSQESMNAAATLSTDLAAVDAKADTAIATADTALATAQAIPGATWDTLSGKPTTFPPSLHSHTVGQVGASPVGQALMSAADAAAARTAIGAGTGNGTSNLTLGTTGTTAAPGNHAHSASQISAIPSGTLTGTDVATQLQQLDAKVVTGSGSGSTVDVLFSSGAYPTQAASPPAGVKVRHFYGPVQYTGAAWAGVLDLYTYAALT